MGKSFRDIVAIEWVSWTPLLVGILVLGLVPSIIFGVTQTSVDAHREDLRSDEPTR